MSDTPDLAAGIQAQAVLASVQAALGAGRVDQAMSLAGDAIASGLEHPLFYNLAASRHEARHEYKVASELLERGLALAPDDLGMLTALGLCMNKLRRTEQALAAFDRALAVDPGFAPAHYGAGVALLNLDSDGARRRFQAALDLMPDYAEPLGALALVEVRSGDVKAARAYAERALAADPRQVAGRSAMALCEVDAGAYPQAEVLARGLVADPTVTGEDRVAAGITLGDALDGQGRFAEAFAAYAAAKTTSRRNRAAEFDRPGVESYPAALERLSGWFSGLAAADWSPQTGEDETNASGHVFILGFARSGTTLLETALDSHPGVVSLDESDAITTAVDEAVPLTDIQDRFASLDRATAQDWRRRYWDRVAALGADVRGKIFVDKQPFAGAILPMISALFPRAKILFALRDPRDVVLSCFRRAFPLTATTYQFTTLEGAARLYDAHMRLAMLYREKLPLDLAQVRYEALCRDFEAEARAVAAFLGLEWSAEMANFAATAQRRANPTSNSRRLARGLASGEGLWRPYATELEPVLPILAPWIERFGYAERG